MAVDTAIKPRGPSLLNDPRTRAIFFQVLVLGGVLLFGAWIVNNTIDNLARQGIASGFSFLSSEAGFAVGMSLIDFSEDYSTYGDAFVVSFLNTILVSVLGVILATIVGFTLGVARLSRNWMISRIAAVYIEIVRNIPLLLQIFFWYFAVIRALPSVRDSLSIGDAFFLNNRGFYVPATVTEPLFQLTVVTFFAGIVASILIGRWARKRQEATGQLFPVFWTSLGLIIGAPVLVCLATGVPLTLDYAVLKGFNFEGGIVIIPELAALLLALTIYTASFIGEIVRAGIQAVSYGQTEAAHSLGLSRGATLRLVVIPQALRVIVPPLTSQYLNLTKNSSLAAAIAYPDMVSVFAGTVLNQTGQAVEVLGITMAVYLTLSLLISMFMNWYNARNKLVER